MCRLLFFINVSFYFTETDACYFAFNLLCIWLKLCVLRFVLSLHIPPTTSSVALHGVVIYGVLVKHLIGFCRSFLVTDCVGCND